ncbi:serine/threonine-protein kinase [Thermoactinospora rubra]|uniref:serine/threonine-protein kinase n=1 Tax=Thermoactinospora rubra TaxID=1088767 RepID=UPI00117E7D60|nr:serine/threonine-protein kinase [Thermoactinospora rubra]
MEPTGAAPLRPTDKRQIGPYRLIGRLGEGGMGTVFLARAPTGRLVAVKVVRSEFANQEGFAARFHAEVDNARRVASFCTAAVLDNGNAEDGRPYMVTEYIAGTPLSEQIAKYGQLDAGTLHGVALGMAAALAAIHNAGLVHRDLKPANVILSLSGPRVIDFGIARALDRESGFTLSGELVGSPGWWAPEQVRGLPVTPAVDIFAWGCVVAYAGNGRHPFGQGSVLTLASRVVNTPPDLGALPAPLNELARQATAMDPASRPTAQDLVLALVGGGAAAPTQVQRRDPPTLVATELLSHSWQPPANLVEEVPPHRGSRPTDPGTGTPAPQRAGRLTDPGTGTPPPAPVSPVHDQATHPPEPERRPVTRWLIAAAAALVASSVTAAVLIATSPDSPRPQNPTPGQTQAQRATDVGRRFALGQDVDALQFVVAEAPRCGLTEYQGTTSTKGQLCVIRWTVLNPGGTDQPLGSPAATLQDDKGGTHEPLPAQVPTSVAPGARVDGRLLFDLPPARTPLRLTVSGLPDGKQIEVTL